MRTVIEIIPFENVQGLNLLLRMNENEKNIEVINHAIVIRKRIRYGYDDRV